MKSPSAIRIEPRRSGVQASVVLAITIILIALCADFMPANSQFSLKNGLWLASAMLVTLWAWVNVWRLPSGCLHFSQGQWIWQLGSQELAGTLHLHLDLQTYMLVRFQPAGVERSLFGSIFSTTAPWFHLEARHFPAIAQGKEPVASAWGDLRRAVYFPCAVSTHELALKDNFNEKPAR